MTAWKSLCLKKRTRSGRLPVIYDLVDSDRGLPFAVAYETPSVLSRITRLILGGGYPGRYLVQRAEDQSVICTLRRSTPLVREVVEVLEPASV